MANPGEVCSGSRSESNFMVLPFQFTSIFCAAVQSIPRASKKKLICILMLLPYLVKRMILGHPKLGSHGPQGHLVRPCACLYGD